MKAFYCREQNKLVIKLKSVLFLFIKKKLLIFLVEEKESPKTRESSKGNLIEQRFTRLRRSDAIVLQQKTDVRSEQLKPISISKPEINKLITSKSETGYFYIKFFL